MPFIAFSSLLRFRNLRGGGYPPPVVTKVAQTPVGARVNLTESKRKIVRSDPLAVGSDDFVDACQIYQNVSSSFALVSFLLLVFNDSSD